MIFPVDDPDDERLNPYRDLRHRDPADGFIAEGHLVVGRLLASPLAVRSVLVVDGQQSDYERLMPEDVPLLVGTKAIVNELVGYPFHRGVLAHADVPAMPPATDWLVDPRTSGLDLSTRPIALGLIGVTDPENVGSLLRSAAALGVRDVFVDSATIPPFTRRVVRVSMATALTHRFYELTRPQHDLPSLHRFGAVSLATTLSPCAASLDSVLATLPRSDGPPLILLMGNEATGLPSDIQAIATHRVTIPMQLGTDSLNVSVAGAIFLYELTGHLRVE